MRVDFSKLILSILFVGLFLAIDLWTKHQVTISTVMHGKSFGPDGILGIVKPVMNYGGGGVFSSDVPDNSYKLWHFFFGTNIYLCFCYDGLIQSSIVALSTGRHPGGRSLGKFI